MSLTWENCVAVCTGVAAALTGSSKGFRGLIKKVTPHTVFNPCRIHRQALVAKDMDEELHNILHKTLLVQLTALNATVLTEPSLFNTLQSDGLNLLMKVALKRAGGTDAGKAIGIGETVGVRF
ncbi:zinc finger MYM-type protein 6 [Trichonephila clavipes]|nr:zinc finger MYM-type protein 6 [Trichonephila clavipes]